MSTTIYYFSGTGNSLRVAKELQALIPETLLIPVVSLINRPRPRRDKITTDSETVGFVFPVYCHTVPVIVKDFIKKLDLQSTRYLFAVATTASTQCRAFVEIDKILKRRRKRLDSFFTLKMPHNMPFYVHYNQLTATGIITGLESSLPTRLAEIQKIIIDKAQHRQVDSEFTRQIPSVLLPFMPVLIPLNRFIVKKFSQFFSDAGCTGCGACAAVCLSGKIKIINHKPLWQDGMECYQCQACINYCPAQSVQQRSAWFMKSYSASNGRHHDPAITAPDIAAQK